MSRRAVSCGPCEVAVVCISLGPPQEPPLPPSIGHRVSRGVCGSCKHIAFPVKSGCRALSPLCSLPQVCSIGGAMAWDITSPSGKVCSGVASGKPSDGSLNRLGVCFGVDTPTHDPTPSCNSQGSRARGRQSLRPRSSGEKSLVISTGTPFLHTVVWL
jgi:hypothetical protein